MSSQSEPIRITRDWLRKGHETTSGLDALETDENQWLPSRTSGYLPWALRPEDFWGHEPVAVGAIGSPNSVCVSPLN